VRRGTGEGRSTTWRDILLESYALQCVGVLGKAGPPIDTDTFATASIVDAIVTWSTNMGPIDIDFLCLRR
jgi:hypothetical protein